MGLLSLDCTHREMNRAMDGTQPPPGTDTAWMSSLFQASSPLNVLPSEAPQCHPNPYKDFRTHRCPPGPHKPCSRLGCCAPAFAPKGSSVRAAFFGSVAPCRVPVTHVTSVSSSGPHPAAGPILLTCAERTTSGKGKHRPFMGADCSRVYWPQQRGGLSMSRAELWPSFSSKS